MIREEQIKAIEEIISPLIQKYYDKDLFLEATGIDENVRIIATAIVDSLTVDKKYFIQLLANIITDELTSEKCCLYDLTSDSRNYVINKAKKYINSLTTDIIKIKNNLKE